MPCWLCPLVRYKSLASLPFISYEVKQRRNENCKDCEMSEVRENQLATLMSTVLEQKFLLIFMECQVNVLMAVERALCLGDKRMYLSFSSCVTWDQPVKNFSLLICNTELRIFFSTKLKFLCGNRHTSALQIKRLTNGHNVFLFHCTVAAYSILTKISPLFIKGYVEKGNENQERDDFLRAAGEIQG